MLRRLGLVVASPGHQASPGCQLCPACRGLGGCGPLGACTVASPWFLTYCRLCQGTGAVAAGPVVTCTCCRGMRALGRHFGLAAAAPAVATASAGTTVLCHVGDVAMLAWCPVCDGRGALVGTKAVRCQADVPCPLCRGLGGFAGPDDDHGAPARRVPGDAACATCPLCQGACSVPRDRAGAACPTCGGKGRVARAWTTNKTRTRTGGEVFIDKYVYYKEGDPFPPGYYGRYPSSPDPNPERDDGFYRYLASFTCSPCAGRGYVPANISLAVLAQFTEFCSTFRVNVVCKVTAHCI